MGQPVRNIGSEKRIPTVLMAMLAGTFGIHKFFLGYTKVGMFTLFLSLFSCGLGGLIMLVIGVVEGFIYLNKTDEEFETVYIRGRRPWF